MEIYEIGKGVYFMNLELPYLIHQGEKIRLSILNEDIKRVDYLGHTYFSFAELYQALDKKIPLPLVVLIHNFFTSGIGFNVIQDSSAYKKKYQERILLEEQDQAPPLLTQYGIYDVSLIEEPKIIEYSLIYYVESNALGIPYRVVDNLSKKDEIKICRYELLPYCSAQQDAKRAK